MAEEAGRREGAIGEAMKDARRARKQTLAAVEDLQTADFVWRPAADANNVLWLLWHVGEVQEVVLRTLEGKKPEWRFGHSALMARGKDGLLPPSEDVLEYLENVYEAFHAHLAAMPEEDLERTFGEGLWQGKGRGLVGLPPRHETYHCGQIAYIRRLMGKPVPDANQRNPYQ